MKLGEFIETSGKDDTEFRVYLGYNNTVDYVLRKGYERHPVIETHEVLSWRIWGNAIVVKVEK